MQFNHLLLCFTACVSATTQFKAYRPWTRKEGYKLTTSEASYVSDPTRRFTYLSHVFSALMTVEDVERSYTVLKRLRAWGKHNIVNGLGPELMEKSEIIHRGFDEFLLNLRKWESTRKDACPNLQRDIMDLARFDSPPSNTPCLDIKESPAERSAIDRIFNEVLHENLAAAKALIEGPLGEVRRDRLFKIEMVIMQVQHAIDNTKPCVPLWEDSWNLLPYQKFTLLKTYDNMLRAPPAPTVSEATFNADIRLEPVKNIFQQTIIGPNAGIANGMLERLGLALGNTAIANRLSNHSFYTEYVTECHARHMTPVYRTEFRQVPVQKVVTKILEQRQFVPNQSVVFEKPIERIPVPPPAPIIRHVVIEEPRRIVIPKSPREVIVEKECFPPDYRLLIETGQAYSRAVQHFAERHALSDSDMTKIRSLVETVEGIIAKSSTPI